MKVKDVINLQEENLDETVPNHISFSTVEAKDLPDPGDVVDIAGSNDNIDLNVLIDFIVLVLTSNTKLESSESLSESAKSEPLVFTGEEDSRNRERISSREETNFQPRGSKNWLHRSK